MKPQKTVFCSPSVLAAVTDLSLVRVCQETHITVMSQASTISVEAEPHITLDMANTTLDVASTIPMASEATPHISLDAAHLELCRRYRPLILKYAHRRMYQHVTEDVQSYLWLLFIEAIHHYDTKGTIPFSGYVKSIIYYGQLNYYKQHRKYWQHEVLRPTSVNQDHQDDTDANLYTALEQMPDGNDMEESIVNSDEQAQHTKRLREAFHKLPTSYQVLLRRMYGKHHSMTRIADELHQSRQAVQQRHQRALAALKKHIITCDM